MARKTLAEILHGETRFGRLTVIRETDGIPVPGNGRARTILCRCDCGTEKEFLVQNVKLGKSLSCGCFSREKNRAMRVTHGDSRCRETGHTAPEYRVWAHMIGRCENEKSRDYANYGGRGISVCPEWRSSYETFLSDVGRRPSDSHQIDRIDNDGDYKPDNCRWVEFPEQCRNKRPNVWLTVDGDRMCLTDAAKRYGIDQRTIGARLRRGWSDERAAKTPTR